MVDFDVVDLPETDHVDVGDTAPDFTRPLVNEEFWEDVALSELSDEGPVLLVFHPMDGSFPATYVWNEVRERGWGSEDHRTSEASSAERSSAARSSGRSPREDGETASADLSVVGISISTPYEHTQFIADREMDYRLFSDPDAGVAVDYGVEHDLDGMAGVTEHRPAIFILGEDRAVEYAWVAEEWPDFPDYDAVEDTIESVV